MKNLLFTILSIFIISCSSPEKNQNAKIEIFEESLSEKNLEMAQSFLDNIITNPEQAQSLLHKEKNLMKLRYCQEFLKEKQLELLYR